MTGRDNKSDLLRVAKKEQNFDRKPHLWSQIVLIASIILLSSCAIAERDTENRGKSFPGSNQYETIFETTIAENTLLGDAILIRASDSGYVAAGSGARGNSYIVKTDQAGKALWQQQVSHGGGTGSNQTNTILELSDGGYLVVGQIPSSALPNFDAKGNAASKLYNQPVPVAFAAKYDKNGLPLWTKGYDPLNMETIYSSFIRGSAVKDGVVLVGTILERVSDNKTGQPRLNNAIRITKIDNAGNLLWAKNLPEVSSSNLVSNEASKVIIDPLGNLIFAYLQQGNRRPDGKTSVVFLKIDQQGGLINRIDLPAENSPPILANDKQGLRCVLYLENRRTEIIQLSYDFAITGRQMSSQELNAWVLFPEISEGMYLYGTSSRESLISNSAYPAIAYIGNRQNTSSPQIVQRSLPAKTKGDAILGEGQNEIVLLRVDYSGDSAGSTKAVLTKIRLK